MSVRKVISNYKSFLDPVFISFHENMLNYHMQKTIAKVSSSTKHQNQELENFFKIVI